MSLQPVAVGGSEYTCGKSTQVKEMLILLVELWEDVGRLRSDRKSEKEIQQSGTLSLLRQIHQPLKK